MNKDNKKTETKVPEELNAAAKSKRKHLFAKLIASSLLLSRCGEIGMPPDNVDGGNVKNDGSTPIERDGGTISSDGGTVDKCAHNTYHVLKVDETEKIVNDGASVMINGKKYAVNDAQDGSLVLNDGNNYYVVKDKAMVNGVEVAHLGSGTTLVNAALLQVEYYNVVADSKSFALGIGESGKYSVDGKHYVKLTLKSVVKTDKVEYAVVEAEVFVRSANDNETFISAKKERYKVGLNEAKQIVVDESTNLAVNLDLLGSGTLNASANLNVNGKQLLLKAGGMPYSVKVGNDKVTIGVLSAFHSENMSRATLVINTPIEVVLLTLLPGEKSNLEINDSGMLLRVEFQGCEPICEE